MPRGLITGITGQDGSYLAELLLDKGYQVYGMVRRTSHHSFERIEHLLDRITIVTADLLDQHSLTVVMQEVRPDEVYNLAAQSYVPTSWSQPVLTGEFTALGVTRILEAIRLAHPAARFYQASSSEMFGKVSETPQHEGTAFYPRSPYGVAKVYGHWITVNYRESYGLYAVSGILFNHESPRRGMEFVTRKVSDGVARIKRGLATELRLGNLKARRDSNERAIRIAEDRSEFALAMRRIGLATPPGVTVQSVADGLDWSRYVVSDPAFNRPAEVDMLQADARRAAAELGWSPTVPFRALVEMMVDADLDRLSRR
ncbi:MAG: GDP-mannose 4,6-dehydratase [Gemmatimonadetes bacterium]|nr:MAG: GDP-mannose 4,6-dehydratase [Gemmatimonadota bacterium]